MKLLPYYIIAALAIVILLMWLFPGKPVQDISAKIDSAIKPHKVVIAKIEKDHENMVKKVNDIKEKAKSDSISYKKKISKLKVELSKAKYTGKPAYVPDDSVQLGMDCLEKERIRDSIDSTKDERISQLESNNATIQKEYEGIMDGYQSEINELQSINKLKDQEVKETKKLAKKERRKGKLKMLGTAVIGVLVGFAFGAVN